MCAKRTQTKTEIAARSTGNEEGGNVRFTMPTKRVSKPELADAECHKRFVDMAKGSGGLLTTRRILKKCSRRLFPGRG
jgi:hypothetical protein